MLMKSNAGIEKICLQCKSTFVGRRMRGHFCSKACYSKNYHMAKAPKPKPVLTDERDADEWIDHPGPKPRREKLAQLFEHFDGLHMYRTSPPIKSFRVGKPLR